MAVILGLLPEEIIGVDPDQGVSKYNAVHNPIVYRFTRYDFIINQIIISGSTADLYLDGLPSALFDAIIPGDQVYVSHATVTGAFPVVLTNITFVRVFIDAGYTPGTYTTDGTLILSTTIKGWRLEIQIGMMDTGTFVPLVTSSWVPPVNGQMLIDISEYLKPQLPLTNGYDYSTLNIKDLNLSKIYALKYREVYIGNDDEEFSAATANHYVTNSAKQIGDLYGGNMGEFVPFLDDVADELKAKFVSGFLTPHYWTIAPFDLAFIYSNELDGTLVRGTVPIDINGGSGIGTNTNLLGAGRYYINRMKLSDLAPTSHRLGVTLAHGLYAVSEAKTVIIEQSCTKHPVYLCWKSKNGAWDYWLFDWNQTRKRNTGDLKQYEPYFTDFEAATARVKVSSKTSVPSMILGASNVPVDDVWYNEQYPGLMGLIDSPEVLLLTNLSTWVADGAKWQTVIPKPGSFKVLETQDRFSQVEIEISLPYLTIETQ